MTVDITITIRDGGLHTARKTPSPRGGDFWKEQAFASPDGRLPKTVEMNKARAIELSESARAAGLKVVWY